MEDQLLHVLFEEKGLCALIVNEVLTITRIECGDPELAKSLRPFCDRNIFDLLPGLAQENDLIDHAGSNSRLTFFSALSLSTGPSKPYNITVRTFQTSGHSPGYLLFLLDKPNEKKTKLKATPKPQLSNAVRINFLANFSHEIRTPMNGVIGMTELLLATKQTREQREYTEIIRTSGEALLTVINDILDYAKIESDHVTVEHEPFELRPCIEQCLDIHTGRAAEKNIELIYSIKHPCPVTIISDKGKLTQILNNLVGNAVKFTDSGDVVISVQSRVLHTTKAELDIRIQDTGIGIPKDAQEDVFSAFGQVHSSQTGRPTGTGLGLTIANRLIELLGGTLHLDSEPGKGSAFYFTVPIDFVRTDNTKSPVSLLKDKRILVVDDNETNRRILSELLSSWRIDVYVAVNASEAMEQLETNMPLDLAILDMHMPGLDGLALAREIRRMSSYQNLPLILLTSIGWMKDESLIKKYDINHYLCKPIKQSQLFDILVGTLEQENYEIDTLAINAYLDKSMAEKWPLDILVAEDNAVNRRFIKQILLKLGYVPDIVSSGRLAVEKVKQKNFDLLLMDIEMPDMDGLEAAGQITKRFSAEERPQIVALTAHAMPGDREKFIKAGLDGYISKPVKTDALISCLKKCLPLEKKTNNSCPQTTLSDSIQNTNSSAIDINFVKQMTGFETDDEAVRDLLQTFLYETGELWSIIQSALKNQDFDQIYRAAHTIKSSSATVGADRFSEFAAALANAADRHEAQTMHEIIDDMREEKEKLFFSLTHINNEDAALIKKEKTGPV